MFDVSVSSPWASLAVGAAIALAGLTALPGCGTPVYRWSAPADRARVRGAKPKTVPRLIRPSRLVALPHSGQSTFSAVESDGSQRLIVNGMRLLSGHDGTLERGEELFPHGRTVHTVTLPERLGGGYVFYSPGSGATLLWRAKTWTAELEPLANVDFEVGVIVPGFDRLYLVLRSTNEIIAIDPGDGSVGDLGALPPSSAHGAMAFGDSWMAAVEADYRGVLVTFDAGASWRPLGVRTNEPHVAVENDQIVVYTTAGRMALDSSGRLHQHGFGSSIDSVFFGVGGVHAPDAVTSKTFDPPARPPRPLGPLPLRDAALHGWPDSAGSAVVALGGALGRVRLSDGKVLAVTEDAYPGGGACHAVPLGRGFGFICGEERGGTRVYAFQPPLAMRPILAFEEPRYVAASGNGGLVIRGECEGARSTDGDSRAYCVRSPKGELNEVRVRGDLGVERVVALSDGRTAVLVPPRRGAKGLLTLVTPGGSAKTVKLRLPKKAEDSMLALLRKGLWLDGFVQLGDSLRGWVAAAGPFVGVRVRLDGRVTVGKMEEDLDRTLISGLFGLAIGRPGLAHETIDGGLSWRELEVPVGLSERGGGLPQRGRVDASTERGCSPVGCAFGSWMRLGWRGKGKAAELPYAKEAPPLSLSPAGGGKWMFRCAATGDASKPVRAIVKAAPRRRAPFRPSPFALPPRGAFGVASADDPVGTAWSPFMGVAPPAKGRDEIGFDLGTEGHVAQLRGYAWGVKGADWARVGRWQIRALDQFAVRDAVWSTEVSRSPWPDVLSASQRFGGSSMRGLHAAWAAAIEPSGRGGVLSVISRTAQPELFVFEEGRTIVPVSGGAWLWDVNSIAGVVKVDDGWYVGLGGGSSATFRVMKISGDQASVFGEYQREHRGNQPSFVVRSARGDALGIWVIDAKVRGVATTWYVYPLDPRTGLAGNPLVLTPRMLGGTPPACGPDDDGWVLTGSAPVEPHVDLEGADDVLVRGVRARVLANRHGLCIEALSASTDVPEQGIRIAPGWRGPPDSARVPLAVATATQRHAFRCNL